MALKRSDFTKANACQNKTPLAALVKTKTNKHFDETLIARQMIEAFITGNYDPVTIEEIEKDVTVSYTDENTDDIDEIQKNAVHTLAATIFRFINSFPWAYGNPNPEEQDTFIPTGAILLDLSEFATDEEQFEGIDDIEVRFTWIRKSIDTTNPDKYNNVGTIEGAILRKGRPDISETTRGVNNPNTDIWLHVMRHALRKYADSLLEDGQQVTINATYYFLRKDSDKSDKTNYSIEDYFADTKGIRRQSEVYTKMPDEVRFPDNDLDTQFHELLKKRATGYEKCDLKEESDCKGCPNYISCYYKEPPILANKDEGTKTLKARGSIKQDSYQQVVTNYRSGTGIVDAPPGSGKTEITTERTVQMAIELLDDFIARYESGEDIKIPVTATFLCKRSDGLESKILVNE